MPSATAILDHFLAHAEVISMTGKCDQLRHQKPPTDGMPDDSKSANARTGFAAKKKVKSTDDSLMATCES